MQKNTETIFLPLTEFISPLDIGGDMVDREHSPSALADALEALASEPMASPYDIDTSRFKTFDHDIEVAEYMSFSECVVALSKRTLPEQKEVLAHPYQWERIQYALDAYRLNLYATFDDEREVSSAFLLMKHAIECALSIDQGLMSDLSALPQAKEAMQYKAKAHHWGAWASNG